MKPEQGGSGWLVWQSPEQRMLRKIVIIAIVTFAVGFLVSALWMWTGAPRHSVVTVPNLRALSLADARRAADGSDLILEVGDSLPNPEIARGQVLTQSPLPGQEVAPGTAVQVIVSTGRERHAVPQVSSLSREQAEQLLIATGLQPVIEEVTDSRRAGRVVGTVPQAGSVVAIPAAVRLLISSGPPLVAVPTLVGLQEMEIAGVLGAAGLRLGESTLEFRLGEPEGQIVGQQPAGDDSIPAGSAVDVVVATQRPEAFPTLEIR